MRSAGTGRVQSLDGLRAVAVLMVMGYHGGVSGLATAGFFGVDVFFVLSGFLITSILLDGGSSLAGFWGRRARRLLPALAVMLVVVAAYVAWVAPAGEYDGFRGDAASVVGYVSNWHFAAGASNYFASSGAPSLLTHTWSLAVEEQFYLLWPLVLLALRRRRAAVGWVASIGALASAAEMAWLHHTGVPVSRLYYGTDTHCQGLLVGAALAAWGRRVPAAAGVAGAAVLGIASVAFGSASPWPWEGGFLLVSLAAAAVIGSITGGSRWLSARPLPQLGRISYAMYLWYFPVFAWIDRADTGLSGIALFVARTAAVVAAAAVSQAIIERPARHITLPRPAVGLLAAPAAVAVMSLSAPPALAAPAPEVAAAPAAGAAGRAERVLVAGDSTGLTLGVAMSMPAVEERFGTVVDVAAQLGCGVAMYAEASHGGVPSRSPAACDPRAPTGAQWPALLAAYVRRFRPAVVMLAAGRWEVLNRRDVPGGPWENLLQAADFRYVVASLERAIRVASSGGARVLLLTAPCYSLGERPDGGPWPEAAPARRLAYDAALRAAARRYPKVASVVDSGSWVCPAGRYRSTVDGVTVRAPDGVHYPFFGLSDPEGHDPDTVGEVESFGAFFESRLEPWLQGTTPPGSAATQAGAPLGTAAAGRAGGARNDGARRSRQSSMLLALASL